MAGLPGLGSFVGFGEEGTWGTGVVPTRYFPLLGGGDSLGASNEWIDSGAIHDAADDNDSYYRGKRMVAGSLDFEFSHIGWTLILKHVFGHAPAPGGGPNYVFAYIPPSIPAVIGKGLSITVVRSPSAATAFRYEGCKINSFTLSAEQNGPLKASIDFIGVQVDDTIAKPSASYAYLPLAVLPNVGTTALMQIGGAAVKCRSFTFKYENNYEARHDGEKYVGSEPYRSSRVGCSMDMVLEFEDLVKHNDFIAGTARTVLATVDNAANILFTIASAANAAQLDSNPTPFVDTAGIVTWSPSYKFRRDSSSGAREVTFTYSNTTDSAIS